MWGDLEADTDLYWNVLEASVCTPEDELLLLELGERVYDADLMYKITHAYDSAEQRIMSWIVYCVGEVGKAQRAHGHEMFDSTWWPESSGGPYEPLYFNDISVVSECEDVG